MSAKAKVLAGYMDNDIELCRTTNRYVGNEAVEHLLRERIPFTKNCRRIPFFMREKYKGATEVYVITTNPDSYGKARRVLDHMDAAHKTRLVVSNY